MIFLKVQIYRGFILFYGDCADISGVRIEDIKNGLSHCQFKDHPPPPSLPHVTETLFDRDKLSVYLYSV